MRESSPTDDDALRRGPGMRLPRRFRGYDVELADEGFERLERRVHDLEHQVAELREELLQEQMAGSEARHDLARTRAELRYWNDRATYVDSEVARARQRAKEIEAAAQERADAVEAEAQQRSLQLIDRVCTEANTMLVSAREEAREMLLRCEADIDESQQRLEQLDEARREVARTMQRALEQVQDAVQQVEDVSPVVREARQPGFGRRTAEEAAERFDAEVAAPASAALSTSLPEVLTAQVHDASRGGSRRTAADPAALVDPAAGDEVVQDEQEADSSERRSRPGPILGSRSSDASEQPAPRRSEADIDLENLLLP